MGTYTSADIRCPFYRRDDPQTGRLTCEGVLPASTMVSKFGDKRSLQRQLGKYCACDYERCPWFRILELKWDMTGI